MSHIFEKPLVDEYVQAGAPQAPLRSRRPRSDLDEESAAQWTTGGSAERSAPRHVLDDARHGDPTSGIACPLDVAAPLELGGASPAAACVPPLPMTVTLPCDTDASAAHDGA